VGPPPRQGLGAFRSCVSMINEELDALDLLSVFDTGCRMPTQVLRSRYIDRKKLAALLNALYKKEECSITARGPKPRNYIEANSKAVEIGQLDYQCA